MNFRIIFVQEIINFASSMITDKEYEQIQEQLKRVIVKNEITKEQEKKKEIHGLRQVMVPEPLVSHVINRVGRENIIEVAT